MTTTSDKQFTPPITLYSYHGENITLKAAIEHCQNQLKGAIALLYSPQSCKLAEVLDNHILQNARNHEINLDYGHSNIFEARIFTQHCELRWLNRDEGVGEAVLLSESKQDLNETVLSPTKIDCQDKLEQQYLLWGKTAKNQPSQSGWQRLAEARIGKLDIPLKQPLKDNQRVYLKTVEYMKQGEFGNYAVIEERLVKLIGE